MNDNLKNTPKKIYLTNTVYNDGDITWGCDRLSEHDVEYVRADLAHYWKPIKDAPRNGCFVNIYHKRGNDPCVDYASYNEKKGCWQLSNGFFIENEETITHYMELLRSP